MDLAPGTQLLLSGKPCCVLSVTPGAHCQVVTLLRPGTLAPPVVSGTTRPGPLTRRTLTMLYVPDDDAWWWDVGSRASVQLNDNPQQHIAFTRWLDAFGQAVRPACVAS